jgi:hypothetical protein
LEDRTIDGVAERWRVAKHLLDRLRREQDAGHHGYEANGKARGFRGSIPERAKNPSTDLAAATLLLPILDVARSNSRALSEGLIGLHCGAHLVVGKDGIILGVALEARAHTRRPRAQQLGSKVVRRCRQETRRVPSLNRATRDVSVDRGHQQGGE